MTARRAGRSARAVDLGTRQGNADAAALARQLKPMLRGKSRIVVDGGQLERLDTAAIQVLVAFVRDAAGRGIEVHWKALSEPARRALERVGALAILGIEASA